MESMYVIQSKKDRGYLLTARGFDTDYRSFVLKTDSAGAVVWAKYYGFNDQGWADMIQQTYDGGCIITSVKRTTNLGAHIIKTDENGNSGCDEKNVSPVVSIQTPTVVVTGINNNIITTTLLPVPSENNPSITVTNICMQSVLSSSVVIKNNLCSGDTTGTAEAYPSGGTSPYTYFWQPGGQTTKKITGLPAGTYTVIVTDFLGTQSMSVVTLTQPPAVTATVTPQQTACGLNNGSAIVIAGGGTGTTYTYIWSIGGQTSAGISGLAAGNYSVMVADTNGCLLSATVSINGSVPITVGTNSAPACGINNGSASAIGSMGTGPYTYSWSPMGGSNSTATGLSSGTYTCTVTDALGCILSASVNAIAYPDPVAGAGANVTILAGDSIVLNATGGGAYVWSPSQDLSCTTCSNPTASPQITTTYCVLVTDSNGCYDNACVTITVDMECGTAYVPTAFSPNGDGKNDLECIYGNCIESLLFIIYDRWGEKVFETSEPNECWDGIYKNKLMNTSVFVYRFDAILINGEKRIQQGNISLIR